MHDVALLVRDVDLHHGVALGDREVDPLREELVHQGRFRLHDEVLAVSARGEAHILFLSEHMTHNVAQHRAKPNIFSRHTDDENMYRGGAPQPRQELSSRN